jgi:alpha-glucosidase
MQYFAANREERGSDVAINFFITYFLDKDEEEQHGLELDKQLSDWQSNLPVGAWSNWCLGSHDSRRITSRLPSKELIDGFYMLLLLQSGTALIYYGDEVGRFFKFRLFEVLSPILESQLTSVVEIKTYFDLTSLCLLSFHILGMCDRPFTVANREEIVDITAFYYGDKHVEEKVRDCQRTPMQWSDQAPYAGFTSSVVKPFLPLSDTWPTLNVEQQQNAKRSHLKLFQQLVNLRQQTPFYGGHQKKLIAT